VVQYARDKSEAPLLGLRVSINSGGFEGTNRELRSTNADGQVQSERNYQNVAFVTVSSAAGPVARFPVEILDERTVALPVSFDPKGEARGELESHKSNWLRGLQNSWLSVGSLITDLNRLKDTSIKEAHERATQGYKTLQADLDHLNKERLALVQEAGTNKLDLADGDLLNKKLKERLDEIQRYIANLEDILKQEADPARAKLMAKIKLIPQLEAENEYRKALDLAREALAESEKVLKKPNPELIQKVKELEGVLGPKDDDHRAAQDFIYEPLPKLEDTEQIKEQVDKARTAFEECRKAGDYLSLRKLQPHLLSLNRALKDRAENLGKGEADREERDQITKVDKVLRDLDADVRKYLKSRKTPAAAK
jgi:hypothetical protein